MRWIKGTLTGLAMIVTSCSTCNPEDDTPPPAGVQVTMLEQDNGISVPKYDWQNAEHRALNFGEAGYLLVGFATQGHVELDSVMYDAVMDLADTNADGNYDLIRVTMDSTITAAPIIEAVGDTNKIRAIIRDVDYDGQADVIWLDEQNAEGLGSDGQYDREEHRPDGRVLPMEYVMDNWLIFD